MIYAMAYSNEEYNNPKKWNLESALECGVEGTFSYSPADIDEGFYKKNKNILDCSRGNGYWLWKPYFILRSLHKMHFDDYLVYADAGAAYVNNVNELIEKMEANGDEIMVFDQPYIEREWSKRDAFLIMDCDREEYCNSHQVMATFIVLKKTANTIKFVEEWLFYCEDERVVTDNENVMGLDNYPGFVENRHDQTVLSLLSKKWGLRVYDDPSCLIYGWLGEKIDFGNKTWLSHRTPYVRSLEDLLRTNKKYYEHYWDGGKDIIIYGAGFRGKLFLSIANKISKQIKAFVVSSEKHIIEKHINDIPVYSMDKFPLKIDESKFIVTVQAETISISNRLENLKADYDIFRDYSRKWIYAYWKQIGEE